tara:strand:+ start:521 stop:700 length:180 start_codon:yes stop_codon:yes gene_type:complete
MCAAGIHFECEKVKLPVKEIRIPTDINIMIVELFSTSLTRYKLKENKIKSNKNIMFGIP